MRRLWLWLVVVGAALAGTSAWSSAAPEDQKFLPAAASGIVIFTGILGTFLLRRQRERAALSAAEDSFERSRATAVLARVFIDALVPGAVLLAGFILFPAGHLAGILVAACLCILVADFCIRFKLQTKIAAQ